MIELLQFAPTIKVLRVQSLDALSLERPNDGVISVEHVAEHGVGVVDRRRRPRGSSTPYILIRVEIDVLDGRQRQGADLYRFGSRHSRFTSIHTSIPVDEVDERKDRLWFLSQFPWVEIAAPSCSPRSPRSIALRPLRSPAAPTCTRTAGAPCKELASKAKQADLDSRS